MVSAEKGLADRFETPDDRRIPHVESAAGDARLLGRDAQQSLDRPNHKRAAWSVLLASGAGCRNGRADKMLDGLVLMRRSVRSIERSIACGEPGKLIRIRVGIGTLHQDQIRPRRGGPNAAGLSPQRQSVLAGDLRRAVRIG